MPSLPTLPSLSEIMDTVLVKADRPEDIVPGSMQVNPWSPGSVSAPAQGQMFSGDPDITAWQLLSSLRELRYRRYDWVLQQRHAYQLQWQKFALEHQHWVNEVNRQIQAQRARGKIHGAHRIAEQVSNDPNAHDPGDFRLDIMTGDNLETVTILSKPAHILNSPHDQRYNQPGGLEGNQPGLANSQADTAAAPRRIAPCLPTTAAGRRSRRYESRAKEQARVRKRIETSTE